MKRSRQSAGEIRQRDGQEPVADGVGGVGAEPVILLVCERPPDRLLRVTRIWAGFHYRFSVRVGQDMGRKIGQHVVESVMQPGSVADAR